MYVTASGQCKLSWLMHKPLRRDSVPEWQYNLELCCKAARALPFLPKPKPLVCSMAHCPEPPTSISCKAMPQKDTEGAYCQKQ